MLEKWSYGVFEVADYEFHIPDFRRSADQSISIMDYRFFQFLSDSVLEKWSFGVFEVADYEFDIPDFRR